MNNTDLTGQRFGRLTVTGSAGKIGGRQYWNCVCDCGKEKAVEGRHLKSGHTKSCGCYRADKPKERRKDLKGCRYGRLTVLERVSDDDNLYWRCRCDCGNICICHKERLKSGLTRSCGCLQAEQRKVNMKNAIHFVDGTCIERISSRREGSNNTSGRRGVYRRSGGKWRAMIGFKGKVYSLGTYGSFEEAAAAREAAERELYDPFINKMKSQMKEEKLGV